MNTVPVLTDPLEGVDENPGDIHVWIPGTENPRRSFCGCELDGGGFFYIPPAEVTESSWCPDCVRIQDGLA